MTVAELLTWIRGLRLSLALPPSVDAFMGDDGATERDPYAEQEREWVG